METTLELQSLVSSAQAGDEESFRVLYSMLSPRVFRFIRPRAKSREDALDVLQETFIDFWKGMSRFSYQGDSSLDAFLYRIASRKLSRVFRLWKREVSLESLGDVADVEGQESDHGAVLDVVKALQSLKSVDKEILILRHIEGQSFSNIATLLGHTENALKVRHHRALSRLKQTLHYE
ncbi:MAG: RNA polymerase sigma factor [Patescibacteria group bacterium]|mgnify:CR=1 FL=1